MERPNRKQNRLSEYCYGQTGSYFVTICTQNRAGLFAMEPAVVDEAGSFPEVPLQNQILHRWIRETQNKYPGIRIENYVIMPDHLHMIVTIGEEHDGCALPDMIRFFQNDVDKRIHPRGKRRISTAFSRENLAKIVLRSCNSQPNGFQRDLGIHPKQPGQMVAPPLPRCVGNGLCAVPLQTMTKA